MSESCYASLLCKAFPLPGTIPSALAEDQKPGKIYADLLDRCPSLDVVIPALLQAHQAIVECFSKGGILFLCGNGGSHCDALHISGELMKSFLRQRPIPPAFACELRNLPFGSDLINQLDHSLPAVVLGTNTCLASALTNDKGDGSLLFAQELFGLGRSQDILLGLSTSGKAKNVRMAASVARAKGMKVIGLTGSLESPLSSFADIAILAPHESTPLVQEIHVVIYHALCAGIEAEYF